MCSAMPSPMPGSSREFAFVLGDLLDALVQAVEQLGDFFVAAIAADHGAVDFEQLRRFLENFGDFSVFHVAYAFFRFLEAADCLRLPAANLA